MRPTGVTPDNIAPSPAPKAQPRPTRILAHSFIFLNELRSLYIFDNLTSEIRTEDCGAEAHG